MTRLFATSLICLTLAASGCYVPPSDSQTGKGGDPPPGPSVTSPISKAAAASPDGYRESRRQSAVDTLNHLDDFKGWADLFDHFADVSKAKREELADKAWEDALNELWDVDHKDWDKEKARAGLQQLIDGWTVKGK